LLLPPLLSLFLGYFDPNRRVLDKKKAFQFMDNYMRHVIHEGLS